MNAEVQKRIRDLVKFVNADVDDFDLSIPAGGRIIFFDRDNKIIIFEYAGEYCRISGDNKQIDFLDKDYVEYFLGNEIVQGVSLENFARIVLAFPSLFRLREKAIVFGYDRVNGSGWHF